MKKYNDMSVKTKIPLMMGIASLLVFSLICVLLMIPLRSTSLEDSSQIAMTAAELAGERLAIRINASASIMPARASVIASLIKTDLVRNEDKRKMMMNDMATLVKSETTAVTNAWVILEPNALDGLDSLYKNHPGSTENGVVSAKWNSNGAISSADYEMKNSLYGTVKMSHQGMMSQPYQDVLNGKTVNMITSIVPIIDNNIFYGVVATDYDVSELCDMIISLNTIGFGKLITDKGFVVAHTYPERVGSIAENGNREILNKLNEGKTFSGFYSFEDEEQYKAYVPIQLGTNSVPWFYAVDVPVEKVYENAKTTAYILISYCIFGIFLIAFAGWLLMQPMIKNIISVTDIIRQLSLGRINIKISKDQHNDEIGTIKRELEHLVYGLQNTSDFAHKIGTGNLNAEYELLSKDDTLGNSLLEMRKSLLNAASEQEIRTKEEKQRNWGTEGLAKFAEILRRDNTNMEALSYNVISNIVKYLDANQGGIFVLNDVENECDRLLELKACFAFDRKKFGEKQIRLGEGLIGTCYLEGEPVYMTDVPNEYINITSGLGEANPRAIFICPLKVNDEIFGVIELASFKKFEPYQLDFIQKVSESIAATISTVRVNIRTEYLLMQTKQQAEEMVNHEEELRQTMEEMQTTQEEMRRREIELQNVLTKSQESEFEMKQLHDLIFQSLNIVEVSNEGIIDDINENTVKIFESATKDDFIGKPLKGVIGAEETEKVMASANKGIVYENEQMIPNGDKTIVVHQKFMPIRSSEGNLLKIMILVFVESE